jgi:hypothetical protein
MGAGSPPSGWRPSATACSPSPSPSSPYILAFLLTGRLWIEHHQLLDPLETRGRHLAGTNLWFLLTVSLLLVCLLVRRELAVGAGIDELVVPKVIRAANAAVLLAVLGGLLVAQVPLSDGVILAWRCCWWSGAVRRSGCGRPVTGAGPLMGGATPGSRTTGA